MSSPTKCSYTDSITASGNILRQEDVSDLIFAKLSLADLIKLAVAQPTLLPKIKALEERWMCGCIELCAGTLGWLDSEEILLKCDGSWMEAWQALEEARTEWLNVSVPGMNEGLLLPETLPWGDEEWSRLHDLPHEAEMQDAYARAALYYPSLLDGCGDPQCDTFPIGVAFYRRTAQAASEGPLGSAETYRENIIKLRRAFYPDCCDDDDCDQYVQAPISTSSLLANLPSPIQTVEDNWDPEVYPLRDLPTRYIERAIFDAAARSAPFVALCVGEAPALSPGVALTVLHKTCKRIGKGIDDEILLPEMAVVEKGVYDEDPGVGHDDEWSEITTLGIDMVEHALKAQLAEVIEDYELEESDLKALSHASAAETPLGLCWGDMPVPQHKRRGNAEQGFVSAAVAALEAHRSELEGLIGAQLRAVLSAEERGALERAEGAATVHPVMLTDSDCLREFWSDAPRFSNDHEGVQAFAFVSKTWALVVASKSASC